MVIWELFEFGSQPHRHLSDDEVLTFVIRERQITLAQPRLKLSHADYWSVHCTEKTIVSMSVCLFSVFSFTSSGFL